MDGVGGRLRSRADELGLSDAEVARRAGLTATRYGHYVTDYREPDLATLVRICRILGLRPDELLGFDTSSRSDTDGRARKKLAGYADVMEGPILEVAVTVMHALAARPSPASAAVQPRQSRGKSPRGKTA